MSEQKKGCSINLGLGWILGIPTAMIGYNIHGSIGWAIFDLIFYPIAWAKWLIMQEVNMSIIRNTFSFFMQ